MAKMKNHDCPLGVSYVAIKTEKKTLERNLLEGCGYSDCSSRADDGWSSIGTVVGNKIGGCAMYIDQFWAGVLTTLVTEVAVVLGFLFYVAWRSRK